VIGTLAVDGRVVTFGTARRGLGGAVAFPGPFSLLALPNVTARPHQRPVHQLRIIQCDTTESKGLNLPRDQTNGIMSYTSVKNKSGTPTTRKNHQLEEGSKLRKRLGCFDYNNDLEVYQQCQHQHSNFLAWRCGRARFLS